jgi:ferredoxin
MVLYFTGTGNSRYTAERIASSLGDDLYSINDALKGKKDDRILCHRRIVLVTPTNAWRIPRLVRKWLLERELTGVRDIWFVMTCGDSIHAASASNRRLAHKKGLNYMGTESVIMPENFIAMFSSPPLDKAVRIVKRAEKKIDALTEKIRRGEAFPDYGNTIADYFMSGPVNTLFYLFKVKAGPFHVTEGCAGCGKCASVCPLNNIRIENGKPVWGTKCTQCMACISYCPVEAIEYGSVSRGKVRYTIEKAEKLREGEK